MTGAHIHCMAFRAKTADAQVHFENGGSVIVSEYGYELYVPVSEYTTVHNRETTTWENLRAQVEMWSGRYPNQRFYIIEK